MKLAPLVLLAVVLALAPATASAADGTYDVEFDVTLAWAHAQADAFDGTIDERVDARAAGRIEGVVLRHGRVVDPGRSGDAAISGASGSVVPAFDGKPTGDACELRRAVPDGRARVLAAGTPDELLFTPMDELDAVLWCVYGGTGDRETYHLASIHDGGGRRAGGPAVARLAVPDGARTERAVDVTVSGPGCPYAGEGTTSCTLTMRGTVTFVRTGGAPPATRALRLPKLQGTGARNGRDNLFIYNLARVKVEGVVRARRSGTRGGQPTEGELEARTVWETRANGRPTLGNFAFAGTGPVWGRIRSKAAEHVWTGLASFDDGWREAPDALGDERRPLEHDHGTCDVRWRARSGVYGEIGRAGGAAELRLTMPNLPGRATGCRSGFDRDAFGSYSTLTGVKVRIPLEALRHATVTIPFSHTWKRGATTLTYRGFLVLRRSTSCRTPPEYPCHTRFSASN